MTNRCRHFSALKTHGATVGRRAADTTRRASMVTSRLCDALHFTAVECVHEDSLQQSSDKHKRQSILTQYNKTKDSPNLENSYFFKNRNSASIVCLSTAVVCILVYSDGQCAELFNCDSSPSISVWSHSTLRHPRLFHSSSSDGVDRCTVRRPTRLSTTSRQV